MSRDQHHYSGGQFIASSPSAPGYYCDTFDRGVSVVGAASLLHLDPGFHSNMAPHLDDCGCSSRVLQFSPTFQKNIPKFIDYYEMFLDVCEIARM